MNQKQYTFNIVNGTVTDLFGVENGIAERESIDDRDTFIINNNQITHTKTDSDGVETTVFFDSNGDGFYTILSETDHDGSSGDRDNDRNDHDNFSGRDDHEAFIFKTANGQVTAVSELDDGVLKPKSIDSNETYTLDGSDVIRTETETSGTEITRYANADEDGQFIRVSEQ